jgi:hypothetical protein
MNKIKKQDKKMSFAMRCFYYGYNTYDLRELIKNDR